METRSTQTPSTVRLILNIMPTLTGAGKMKWTGNLSGSLTRK